MKRVLSVLLALSLVLGCAATALAAAITITQQPETQTVKAGGTVTFKVKAKNAGGAPVTWYFTNPTTGETTTGKKLSSMVKGVKVQNPNSLNITLKKVPEEMHGWTLYARIGPKSGGVLTDTVMILIKGKEVPSTATVSAAAATPAPSSGEESDEGEDNDTDDGASDDSEDTDDEDTGSSSQSGRSGNTTSSSRTQTSETAVNVTPEIIYVTPEPTPEPGPIVIKANKCELYRIDRSGNLSTTPETELTFDGMDASFYVKIPEGTEGTIQYVLIDGVRLTPEGAATGMSIRGWDHSATVKIQVDKNGSGNNFDVTPEAEVDDDSLVSVTCTNCRFTGYKSTYANSGKVPAGTTITVIADGGLISKGYSINGAKAEYKNQATFQLTVESDTTISMEAQKGLGTSSSDD